MEKPKINVKSFRKLVDSQNYTMVTCLFNINEIISWFCFRIILALSSPY